MLKSYSRQDINSDDIAAVVEVLQSDFITQGSKVTEFEEAIAKYVDAEYCVTFNSATSALHAAYSAAGITEGDEVITTPISFVATSNMLVELGAKPIFCDVKLDGNIDERQIEKLITPKTKAIVPVHFAGKCVNLDAIHTIAKKYKLLVIEDAAHAFGSRYQGKRVGGLSDMSAFSFHAIKPITTGEGGAITTNNQEYAEKLRLIRSHGIIKKELYNSDMSMMGYNYRLTDFAAALGLSQLHRIEEFLKIRNDIATYYDERFQNAKLFMVQKQDEANYSARHLYPIILNPELQCPKEDIFKTLQEKGIGVQVHYKPIYQNSFYRDRFGEQSLFVANDFYRSELSLPCHQKMSLDDAKVVADTFEEVLSHYAYRGCSF